MHFSIVEEGRGSSRSCRSHSMRISYLDFSVSEALTRENSDSQVGSSHWAHQYSLSDSDMKYCVIDLLRRQHFSMDMISSSSLGIVSKRLRKFREKREKYTIVIRHRDIFSIYEKHTYGEFRVFFAEQFIIFWIEKHIDTRISSRIWI